ncbi:MAG: NAD(P)/FAD-dependent oxidoreductase [Microthrixaceae bacterium]
MAVVGAGLAGLTAARDLLAAGRDVVLLEASDGVGGRVRSDLVDGFVLDRGFQVLLTAYPEVQRCLDLDALDLREFDAGALVRIGGRFHRVGDPFRDPGSLLPTATAPVGTFADKLRMLQLRRSLVRTDPAQLLRGEDVTTLEALSGRGFSEKIVQRFFGPLAGGFLLDPDLGTSRRIFDVIFRTLAVGAAAVPATGMGAITDQLAASVGRDRIRTGAAATRVAPREVVLDDGEVIRADDVVVAVEGPAASRLLGLPPVGSRGVSCCWFGAPEPPTDSRAIILDGQREGPALNVAVMSNVAPAYAPAGAASVVAACPGFTDPQLEPAVREQLRRWWGSQVDRWEHLRTDVIEHAQPDQSPPLHPKQAVSLGDGIHVCGDHRDTGSIQGAMFSGARCAEAVIARGNAQGGAG